MPSAKVLSPHSSNEAPAESGLRGTRSALLVGFGVLLVLLVLCGLNALAVVRSLQTNNESILRNFLEEQKRLDQVRSAIYLSGTYLRDYLLEPDPADTPMPELRPRQFVARVAGSLSNYPGVYSTNSGAPDQRGSAG